MELNQSIDYSIIIPAYNAIATLPRCIEALQHQSIDRSRYEIIVVDDGSIDPSLALVQDLLKEDLLAKVISVQHGGQAAARNAGVKIAAGNLILFTDADCEPKPNWLEQMASAFNEPNVVGAKGIYCTHQKSLIARFVQQEYEDKYDRMKQQSSIDFIDTYSAAYRRQDFVEQGGFNPSIAIDEDQEFSFRLASQGKRLVFVPDAIVAHQHVTSLVKYFRRKYQIGFWKAYVLKLHPEKTMKDSHTPQSVKIQMGLLALSIGFSVILPLFAAISFIALLFSMLPFLIKIAHRDPSVLLIAPIMIIERALALGIGLVFGFIHFNILKRS